MEDNILMQEIENIVCEIGVTMGETPATSKLYSLTVDVLEKFTKWKDISGFHGFDNCNFYVNISEYDWFGEEDRKFTLNQLIEEFIQHIYNKE